MKNIALAAATMLFSMTNLIAQKNVNVDYAVTTSFKNEFKDAAHVQWSKVGGDIFMSRFDNREDHCIAYFTKEGKLILTGRKISFDIVPLTVKKRTEQLRAMHEEKNGSLTVQETYEIAGEYGTEYFINLTGQNLALSILVYGDGNSKILKKSDLQNGRSENIGTPLLAAGN